MINHNILYILNKGIYVRRSDGNVKENKGFACKLVQINLKRQLFQLEVPLKNQKKSNKKKKKERDCNSFGLTQDSISHATNRILTRTTIFETDHSWRSMG